MKIESYRQPKSSFLAMEKDMSIITDLVLKNKRLTKLLHYTTPDALKRPNLTEEETYALFGKNIKIVPCLIIDPEVLIYLVINFDSFIPNDSNPEFRDNLILFDVVCHYDQWHLQDFALRPFKIVAELDSMLDKKKLTGIGELHFMGANIKNYNDEFGGVSIAYEAIHGGEDQKFMPNPADNEQFIQDFNEMFND